MQKLHVCLEEAFKKGRMLGGAGADKVRVRAECVARDRRAQQTSMRSLEAYAAIAYQVLHANIGCDVSRGAA